MEASVVNAITRALAGQAPAQLTRSQLESLADMRLASIAASLSSRERPGASKLLARATAWKVPTGWVVKVRAAYLESRATRLEKKATELRSMLGSSRVELDFVCRESLIHELEAEAASLRRQSALTAKLAAGEENAAPGDITDSMIAKAREVSLEEVIGEPLNKKICCPLHAERTPSAMIRIAKNGVVKLFCYGSCKDSWDVIAFVRKREELSFPAAVRWLLEGKYK